jgi:hypothetical protein
LGKAIWKNKAAPKAMQLLWLAAQDRVWTSERQSKHGFTISL